MKILGVSAFYHDSAAAIIHDGEIIAAAQEERWTRKKHDPAFPSNAIRFCLEYAGCTLDELDAIVFYDKPFLKFERLLETYCAFAPKGLISFLASMPVWIREKLFLKKIISEELSAIQTYDKKKIRLLFSVHHLSHAASAFYPSPFEEAAILSIDGVGEWATASICKGEGNAITVLKELDFPHSPGLLYSTFTYYCGFEVNGGEYKLMGLAPFGNRNGADYHRYLDIIKSKLVTIQEDGSIFMNQDYFTYATGLRMAPDSKWKELFGFGRREPEAPIEQCHCDLALAIQAVTEEIILGMAGEARRLTGSGNLCMAGGVALNCVANGKLQDMGVFREIFIQPAAGDAGGALGAALAAYYIHFDGPRVVGGVGRVGRVGEGVKADEGVEVTGRSGVGEGMGVGEGAAGGAGGRDGQKGSFLGTEFSDEQIDVVLKKVGAVARYCSESDELIGRTAALLAEGNVIGWHQGRMEFGPRALGARSILADARNPEMQKKLNLSIKFRESFRPFAPVVLAEDAADYFEIEGPSPYMLLVKKVREERRRPLPEGYDSWGMMDKLYFQRSDIPSVTHVDYSARVQTVHRDTNERLWKLLQEFRRITGYSVLINTSFNVRDEPIVNSPEDAWRCFMNTGMDYLVVGNYILAKKDQLPYKKELVRGAAAPGGSGWGKKIGYFAFLVVASLLLLEGILRIHNPFHFRIRGDRIVLDANTSSIVKNDKIPVLSPEILVVKNSLGFRGPEKPAAFRDYLSIITVGGSTTECNYLSEGETWSDQLYGRMQHDFDHAWLNNAGLSGHSTFGHLIMMEDYVARIRPDMVLFLIGANDVGRDDLNSADRSNSLDHSSSLGTFLSKHSELVNTVVNLLRVRRAKTRRLTDNNIDLIASKVHYLEIPDSLARAEIGKNELLLPAFSERVGRLVGICKRHGIEPVLITQPSLVGKGTDSLTGADLERIDLHTGYNGKLWWQILEMYNDVTRQVAKKENVMLIDLGRELPKNSLYFYDMLHFTARGAGKVSEIVYAGLKNELSAKYAVHLKK